TLQYRHQIIDVRKVLHYRVHDHQVEITRLQILELRGRTVQQFNVLQILSLTLPLTQLLNRRHREVRPNIHIALRCQMLQQQAHATTYLQNSPWPKCSDSLQCVCEPLLHLSLWNRLTGVTTIPAYKTRAYYLILRPISLLI